MPKNRPGADWHLVGPAADIDEEDVMQFDHADKTYAIYHTVDGFFATEGLCTHEEQHLADGLVIEAKSAPVCVDLKTYPVQIDNGYIYIQLD